MSDLETFTPRELLVRTLGDLWWVILLRGVLLLILGCYALFVPGITVTSLVFILGWYVIAEGILAIINGIMGRTPTRTWTIVRGGLAVLAGIFIVAHSFLVAGVTATTVMYLVGLAAIVLGILEIVGAVQDRKEIEGEGWLMLGGAMMIVLGVLLLIAPLRSGLLLVRILGVYAIIFGVSQIVLSFRARRLGRHLRG
jgi:uncharacterized membrane protein HdeD (DUF308 family)